VVFHDGDFVYGLRDARTPLINQLRAAKNQHLDGTGIYTADAINFLQLEYSELPAWTEAGMKKKTEELVTEGRIAASDTTLVNRFMWHMLGKTVICNWVGVKRDAPESVWQIKACQAAILIPGITIHFILDGIDLKGVVEPTSYYYGSFTSSELRFIYRYHMLCQARGEDLNVRFYREGEIAPPPWTDTAWAPLLCPDPEAPLELLDSEVYYEDRRAYNQARTVPGDTRCHVILTNGEGPAVKRSKTRLNSPSKIYKLPDFGDV